MRCSHPETALFRHPFASSPDSFHVAEHCLKCGANVRGKGAWVPRSEVEGDPAALPAWQGLPEREVQRGLFD